MDGRKEKGEDGSNLLQYTTQQRNTDSKRHSLRTLLGKMGRYQITGLRT